MCLKYREFSNNVHSFSTIWDTAYWEMMLLNYSDISFFHTWHLIFHLKLFFDPAFSLAAEYIIIIIFFGKAGNYRR